MKGKKYISPKLTPRSNIGLVSPHGPHNKPFYFFCFDFKMKSNATGLFHSLYFLSGFTFGNEPFLNTYIYHRLRIICRYRLIL